MQRVNYILACRAGEISSSERSHLFSRHIEFFTQGKTGERKTPALQANYILEVLFHFLNTNLSLSKHETAKILTNT